MSVTQAHVASTLSWRGYQSRSPILRAPPPAHATDRLPTCPESLSTSQPRCSRSREVRYPREHSAVRENPQRRAHRPWRRRQDNARRSAAGSRRRAVPTGTDRGRDDGLRFRARRGQEADIGLVGTGPVSFRGLQDQCHRHPGICRLHRRGRGGPVGRRPRRARRQCRRGRRGSVGGDLAACDRSRHPQARVRQQARPRARRLREDTGPAPRAFRLRHRAIGAAHRSRGGVQRDRGPPHRLRHHLQHGQAHDRTHPREHVRASAACPRGPDRRDRRR